MPLNTQPLIHEPDILAADASPLIHLSQAGVLHLLREVGGAVVVVDMVMHEATRDLSNPDAAVLKA